MPAAPRRPASSQQRDLGTLAPTQTSPQNDAYRPSTPTPDPGDPVSILTIRGTNEGNRTDISALAGALETFGDFKCGTSWNLGKEGAMQLMAITKLLREASLMYGEETGDK
jgi:hypothetical protein